MTPSPMLAQEGFLLRTLHRALLPFRLVYQLTATLARYRFTMDPILPPRVRPFLCAS